MMMIWCSRAACSVCLIRIGRLVRRSGLTLGLCVQRINIQEIKNHEWFLKNLPADLVDLADRSYDFEDPNHPPQSIEEIMRIISEAREPGAGSTGHFFGDPVDDMDLENDADVDPDIDSSGEFVCAM